RGHGPAQHHRPEHARAAARPRARRGRRGRDALHQRVLDHGGRRLRQRGGEARERLLALAQGAHRLRIAGLQQGLETGALLSLEPAQGVRRRQLADLVAIHVAESLSPLSAPRSRSSPSRVRVFTVPSGSPSRVAISDWVSPSKNASSITRRCASGSWPSAVWTSPRSSATTAGFGASPSPRRDATDSSTGATKVLSLLRMDRSRSIARVLARMTTQASGLPRLGS